jgi:hypothetical protein
MKLHAKEDHALPSKNTYGTCRHGTSDEEVE